MYENEIEMGIDFSVHRLPLSNMFSTNLIRALELGIGHAGTGYEKFIKEELQRNPTLDQSAAEFMLDPLFIALITNITDFLHQHPEGQLVGVSFKHSETPPIDQLKSALKQRFTLDERDNDVSGVNNSIAGSEDVFLLVLEGFDKLESEQKKEIQEYVKKLRFKRTLYG